MYMTPSSKSTQSTRPTGQKLGKNYSSFLDFTCDYERTSECLYRHFQQDILLDSLKCFEMKQKHI